MSAPLSVLDSPAVAAAALILSLGLAVSLLILAARTRRLAARLEEAWREASALAAERDGVVAELCLTRERLAQSRQAAGRAQAAAAELEVRFKPAVTIERHFGERHFGERRLGESRCEAANRVIVEALRDRPQ